MKFFKKLPLELAVLPMFLVAFLFTRLYNIMSLPIFTDEAIYTRWSQIAKFDASWRFISLTDGKQPLFVWADIIMMKLIDDPLLAGRVVSVVAGLLTVIGIYFLSREVFSGKDKSENKSRVIGIIASALYIFYPFSVIYDRMALYESMVAMFFVWALYLQFLLVKKLRLDVAMVLGIVLGGSVLTKSTGFLSIYLTPFLLLSFNFAKKGFAKRFIRFILLSGLAAIMAYTMYSILRLSPFFYIIDEKNSIFIYPVSEWLKFKDIDKLNNFLSNSRGLWDWFLIYFTLPFTALLIASFFVTKKFLKEKLILVIWFLLPMLLLGIFGKTLYPRYVFFMTMPLLPLVAFSAYELYAKYKNIILRLILIVSISILPLRTIYFVLNDFSHAPIPQPDLLQYLNGWPAGGGIKESIKFFEEKSEDGPIYVATQGTFGLLPAAFEIYLYDNHKITVKGYWPTENKIPDEVLKISKEKPTYFVFYQDCPSCPSTGIAPIGWPLKKIASYQKGISNAQLNLYQVIPNK